MNADEAAKCVEIARRALETATCEADLDKALRFAHKALKLKAEYAAAEALVREIAARRAKGFAESASKASSAERASSGARSGGAGTAHASARANGASETKASTKRGTPEQEKLIARIKKAGGDYYEVLGVPRGSSEVDIKKAYRKVALKLHPDKCQATGAEEVFKTVNKAFACLSDPDKKAAFDRYGSEDPASAGFGPGMRRRHPGGAAHGGFDGFGDDFDPAEIFNMFFNGGMGGMGGGFGPGFRVHTFGGNPYAQRRHHARQQHRHPGASSASADDSATLVRNILHLLPLLLPFMLYFLSPREEFYSFVRTSNLKDTLKTSRMNIPFYANKHVFEEKFADAQSRRRIEHQIESERVQHYQQNCQYERSRWTMTTRPNCDKLRALQAEYPSVFRSQYSPW